MWTDLGMTIIDKRQDQGDACYFMGVNPVQTNRENLKKKIIVVIKDMSYLGIYLCH